MTTLTTIVNNAFRESGITPVGVTPDTAEASEALTLLCNLIASLYTDDIGETLTPYNVGANGISYPTTSEHIVSTLIPINSALACNLTAPLTLYLDPLPHDGALITIFDASSNFATNNLTINGNGRKIAGSTSPLVLNSNGVTVTYMYNVGTGWSAVVTLSLGTDVSPFASKYDDMLSIMLALRINPRYGAEAAPETLAYLKKLHKQFKAQYRHKEEVSSENGITALYSNPYWRFRRRVNFGVGTL
jgi:hypothetical protein